jgi:hypothetical protein
VTASSPVERAVPAVALALGLFTLGIVVAV